jgi:hypothetical protein
MRRMYFIAVLSSLISCEQKKESLPFKDFTDKAINLAVEGRDYEFIELPDLYKNPVTRIPAASDDSLILAARLQDRGFKITERRESNMQLSGKRILSVMLVKDDCECEVQKTYFFTQNISEYLVSEKMRCIGKN